MPDGRPFEGARDAWRRTFGAVPGTLPEQDLSDAALARRLGVPPWAARALRRRLEEDDDNVIRNIRKIRKIARALRRRLEGDDGTV